MPKKGKAARASSANGTLGYNKDGNMENVDNLRSCDDATVQQNEQDRYEYFFDIDDDEDETGDASNEYSDDSDWQMEVDPAFDNYTGATDGEG